MKNTTTPIRAALLVLFATACGGGDSNGGGGTGGTSGNSCGSTLVASTANNYSFSSTLTFPPISVKPETELTFDWSAVSKDFLGHPVDAKMDIDTVSVFMWTLTQSELETKLNDDTLLMRDITTGVPVSYFADGSSTSAKLYQFTIAGNPIMPSDIQPYFSATTYDPAKYTYTAMAASGNVLGQGTRMIQAFKLDPASTTTTVTLTPSSTNLTFTANLHSLTPTLVPAGNGGITLDWGDTTALPKNSLGHEWLPNNITSALVGHYNESPAELEGQKFLDLELIATEIYRGDIESGHSVNLSTLKSSSGQAFKGIDSSGGTWIVALRCGNCRNPAPWYLAVLKPCG